MSKKNENQISATYAKAFFDAAQESGNIEKSYAESIRLSELFTPSDIKSLTAPILEKSAKLAILQEACRQNKLSQETLNLLAVLLENGRLQYLPQVLNAFKQLYDQAKNIAEISITSAQKLTAAQEKKLQATIKSLLSGEIRINYSIKPEIIGGLVVEYDNQQFDDSVLNKLNYLQKIMKGES